MRPRARGRTAGRCDRRWRAGDCRRGVEQLEHALGRRHGRLHHGVLRGEVPQRHEELVDVLDERDQRAEGQGCPENLTAAVPDDEGERNAADRLHQRVQCRFVDVGPVIGLAVQIVVVVELAKGLRLAHEQLDHHHPRDRLLQVGVQPGDALADQPITVPRLEAEEVDRHQHERQQRQADQGEPQVDRQHDGGDAEQGDRIHQDGHGAGREHLVDHVDVGGHAGHQPSDGMAIEECRLEFLHVREDVDAQVGEALLRHQHGQIVLQVEKDELADYGGAVEQSHGGDAAGMVARDVAVDGDLQDVRLRQHERRGGRQTGHGEPEVAPVGADVPP